MTQQTVLTILQWINYYVCIGLGMWLGLVASERLRRATKPKAQDLIGSMLLIPLWPAGLYVMLKDSR